MNDITKVASIIQKSTTKIDGDCDTFTIQIRRLLIQARAALDGTEVLRPPEPHSAHATSRR